MADNALVRVPVLESRPNGLARAVAAVRERLGRVARARRSDTGTLRDVVGVGSIIRVFAVDALREVTLIVAPKGWSGTTPGVVPADNPIAAALVGGRVGETRQFDSPSGPKRLQIVNIVGRLPAAAPAVSMELPHARVVRATPAPDTGALEPRTVPLPEAA